MIRDVTERRRAQDEMSEAFRHERDAVKRLVALDQMRNTFLQAVSHELRTPLASIVGMAVTLERDELRPNEAQTREFARLIATNAKKLESMVTDLLDVERLERGILEPRRSRTDIGDLIRRIVTAFEPLSGREVHVDAPSLDVEVDVPKVERIVENLLSNAARHTPQESRVWVGVRKYDEGVLIYVDDEGPGIAPAVREHIFDPFEQGNVVHVEAPGLGIGLSLVARFAELHGGRAWVEQRPGGGAAFRVYLPDNFSDVSN
jgi:two-component system sensor histidine kinase KdpD